MAFLNVVKEKGEHERKVTRRQFLKTGVYAGVGAGAGVLAGMGANKIYGLFGQGLGYIGQELADLDYRVDKMEGVAGSVARGAKSVEKGRASIWKRIFGVTEEDNQKSRGKLGVETEKDRKDFDSGERKREAYERKNLVNLGVAGTVGAGAGLILNGYNGIKNTGLRRQAKKLARVQDEVEDLREQIKSYETRMGEGDYSGLRGEVDSLKEGLNRLHEMYNSEIKAYHHMLEASEREDRKDVPGQMKFDFAREDLEGKVEGRYRGHVEGAILILSAVLFLVSMYSLPFVRVVGFVIYDFGVQVGYLSVLGFLASLAFFYVWVELKKDFNR